MKPHFKRNWFWYILTTILLVGNGYLYLSRQWEISQFQKKMDEEQHNYEIRVQSAKEKVLNTQLKISTQVFSWAMREFILHKNLDQANQLMQQFIQEPGVISVTLVNTEGKITLSSDKKLEGKKYKNIVSGTLANTKEVILHKESEFFHVAAPVYSFSKKIGTVIVKYIDLEAHKVGPMEDTK